jgi:long-chain fatty acid transport protein
LINLQPARASAITLLTAAIGLAAVPAAATEGYFAIGYSPNQRATAGAGVANGTEAMSAAINPAGVAGVGRQFQVGVEFFAPYRGYEASGTGFVPSGNIKSDANLFLVPNLSYNMPLDNGAVLNLSMYGNGGMNTTYPTGLPGCGSVYCGGAAGIDLSQLFVSFTYAKKVGNLSFGISPTLVAQRFEAKGLGAFTGPASSVNGAAMTDNGYDWSYGYGLRGGIEVDLSDTLRFGLSAQSQMYMTRFDKYAGLFEDGGDFDIPAAVTAGIAWDARPDLTLMADVKKIFYSNIGAVGNSNTAGLFGATGGAGFGWDDVNVVKIGAEWRQSDRMTWRAGYAYASNPVGPEDVTLNILAPGIVQHHLALGGSLKMNDRSSLDFAINYVPESTVTGPETTPLGPTPGSSVKLKMNQFSLSVGWSFNF